MLCWLLFACNNKVVEDRLVPLPTENAEKISQQIHFMGTLIEQYPDKAEYYFRRAKFYLAANKELLAATDINKAVELDSTKANYFFLKASILDLQGDYKKGLLAAQKAEKLGVQEIRLQKLLGKMLVLNQKMPQALPYLEKAQKIFPKDSQIYYYQGLIHSANKDTLRAVDNFGKALQIEPRYEAVFIALTDLFVQLNMPKKALEYAQNGIHRIPKSALLYYKSAKIYLRESKKIQAQDYLQRTLRADSTFWQASFELYRIYSQQKDLKTAARYLEKALREKPDITNGFLQLAWIYETQYKDFGAALKAYQKAQKSDPKNTHIDLAIERINKRIAEEAYKQTDEYREMLKQKWLRQKDSLKRVIADSIPSLPRKK